MIILRSKNFTNNLPAVVAPVAPVQAEEVAAKKGSKLLNALKNNKKLAIAATAGTAAVGAGAYAAKKLHDKNKQKEFASTRKMMKAAQKMVDDGIVKGVVTNGTRRTITAATAPGMNRVAFTKEGDKILRRTANKTIKALEKNGVSIDKVTREQALVAGNQAAKNEALAAIKRGGKLPKTKF